MSTIVSPSADSDNPEDRFSHYRITTFSNTPRQQAAFLVYANGHKEPVIEVTGWQATPWINLYHSFGKDDTLLLMTRNGFNL